ncbi:serine/arginine repetitive matrix protein 1-like [Zalophus californianus]|uniref:Serine/arginine repetitive matrix protein 1-like n=1 Tax=Zalophus californianus TaxID=9704 RepID=A0A6J2DHZ0_ZALCA|nr:serine/arginine repetitive matrix protein 1-like [Zalophus californianus]XP_027955576.1 serine/arginine repetitive matrix protein 1-like [Eumetopias jubatus]
MFPGAVRERLKNPATGTGGTPVAERPPAAAPRDHPSHLKVGVRLLGRAGPRRHTNRRPVPRRASPGPRRAPAPRPRSPRETAAGHPRLRHRKRRRLGRPEGLRCRGKGSRGQRPEKQNVPGSRGEAHASPLRPPPPGLGPAGQPEPPRLRRDHRRRSRKGRGSPRQEHSPRLAGPLRRRLSPQPTACPVPAPDAI